MKGSYLLILSVKGRIVFKPGALPKVELPPGCYVYVGSAKGPGGFEKRVSRHLKKVKKARWHIDYLTSIKEVEIESIFYTPPEYNESVLSSLLESIGFRKVLKGFGATDYPKDFSHLFSSKKDVRRTIRRIGFAMRRRSISFIRFDKSSLRSLL